VDAKRVFSFNNFLLTALSGAAQRIGFAHTESKGAYHQEIPLPGDVTYEPEILAALFGVFASSYTVPTLRLSLSLESLSRARAILSEKGIPGEGRPVAIHPGGRGTKQWPARHFAEVCRRLLQDPSVLLLVFMGPDEKGMEPLFPADARLWIVKSGKASELAAMLSHCRLLICNDTGALHVAAAVGTPTLSIFISSSPIRLAPRGEVHHVLDGSNGMSITPEKVAEKARQMMGGSPSCRISGIYT